MGFLLGAFGKMAAGRRVRDLQARMMRVQSRMRRATRQIETVSKMLETQKKAELNGLQAMGTMANASMGGAIFNFLKQGGMNIDQNKFMQIKSGMQFNTAGMTDDDRAVYGAFQNAQTQMKANNELLMTQMKQQIEEKYENLNDALLEPLKMEEDSLQTEKDSLESQIQIAQQDYEACKKMESSDAKNLAPNYTGQG